MQQKRLCGSWNFTINVIIIGLVTIKAALQRLLELEVLIVQALAKKCTTLAQVQQALGFAGS